VFNDTLHLQTLGIFIEGCGSLQPKVNVKNIITSLIDRLAGVPHTHTHTHTHTHIHTHTHTHTHHSCLLYHLCTCSVTLARPAVSDRPELFGLVCFWRLQPLISLTFDIVSPVCTNVPAILLVSICLHPRAHLSCVSHQHMCMLCHMCITRPAAILDVAHAPRIHH
jgi:hypothetical protein